MNPDRNQQEDEITWSPLWLAILLTAITVTLLSCAGCVQHSPGAKVATTVNVSIIPPSGVGL